MVDVTALEADYVQSVLDPRVERIEVVSGNIIATKFDGSEEDLGNVQGPAGDTGPTGSTAIEVCTSGTRPGSPFDGLHIYETDTWETLVWSDTKWIPVDCKGRPYYGFQWHWADHSVAVPTLTSWSPTETIVVPDWAEYIQVMSTVSGMYAEDDFMGIGMATIIDETTAGTEVVFNFDNPLTRQSATWTDEIDVSAWAGTSTGMEIWARRIVGAGTLHADEQSSFRFLYRFTAYP